jgi:hypothetical protein
MMATISLACPEMKVSPINGRLRRTAAEPMTCTITDGGASKTFGQKVVISSTDVNRVGLGRWMVRACVGSTEGLAPDGLPLVQVSLPEESVLFDPADFTMDAQPIVAPVSAWWQGRRWKGAVTFPLCKTNLLTGIAQPVTAEGEVS